MAHVLQECAEEVGMESRVWHLVHRLSFGGFLITNNFVGQSTCQSLNYLGPNSFPF